ncbi:MAG: helix-turn-helix domain-containing protein [Candidatus Zixiibacteriota bacterium]|nr:MAG: helix-turn-helix domain-containing protein [candidate division Zixibacteria bacterium]
MYRTTTWTAPPPTRCLRPSGEGVDHVKTDIMTLEEVAAYLKLKPQTIYTWAQEKRIPAAKLGKEWRFRKSILDEWFASHIDEKFADVVEAWKDNQGTERESGH